MSVVSRDVVVQFLPETLDDVVIRRVRRQEVQHDTPTERLKTLLDAACLMDDVVVEHQMDTLRASVSACSCSASSSSVQFVRSQP